MRKINKVLAIFTLIGILYACDDVLEEDITNDSIQIIAPTEGTVIEGNTANFSWTSLKGADEYRIQIVNDTQVTVLDSLVTGTVFNYAISPGDYNWRIKGVNFAYETAYTFPSSFSVEASNDLTNQSVLLGFPSDSIYTNNDTFTFTWAGLITADSYTFELVKNDNGQQIVVGFPVSGIIDETYAIIDASIFDVDAEYIWKVKALNTTTVTETEYSLRSIFIDRVAPNQPVLGSPIDQDTTTDLIVNFNWTNGTDLGNLESTITNTIEIASDIDFNIIIETFSTVNNSYQYTFANTGTYYWRVKANDAAGNSSDNSSVRSLEIQ